MNNDVQAFTNMSATEKTIVQDSGSKVARLLKKVCNSKVLHFFKQYKNLCQVMHTCDSMMIYCLWQGSKVKCGDFFKTRPTDNGFCCSFNGVSQSEQL
jgi:hypothetical protein